MKLKRKDLRITLMLAFERASFLIIYYTYISTTTKIEKNVIQQKTRQQELI